MMMKLEGIVLDTCYTGKAFAGLVRRAREGCCKPEDNVLLLLMRYRQIIKRNSIHISLESFR